MSTLHVRNLPEEVYEALRDRAAEHGTSISSEAIRLLKRALRTDTKRVAELLAEIERNRPRPKGKVGSAADLIREDRDR